MATVQKRLRTKADGSNGDRWLVRWTDPATGKRPGKSFDLKKDADAFRRKVEREIEDGLHVTDKATKTVGEVAEEYLRHCEQKERDGRIGRTHLGRETAIIKNRIIPALGGIVIRDLSHVQVEEWYGAMISTPTTTKPFLSASDPRRKARPPIKPVSAKHYVYTLKYIEQFALRRGYLKTQPVSVALTELRGITNEKVRTFTPAEVARLMNASEDPRPFRGERDRLFLSCMVALGALCGLRQGEILGLTMDNVDLDRGMLRVRHNLTKFDELKGPKTAAGRRDVAIPERAAQYLREWIERFYGPNERRLVFRTRPGNKITALQVHRSWRALLDYAGLTHEERPFHFHALRHFHASWLVHNGVPITDVSAMLGHSHFDMTLQVYAHPVMTPDHRRDAVNRVAGLLTTTLK